MRLQAAVMLAILNVHGNRLPLGGGTLPIAGSQALTDVGWGCVGSAREWKQ